MTFHLTTLHIPRRHIRKRKSWTIIGLLYVPLEFQPKMKNWIYNQSTGFLNYTCVLSKRAILMGLHNCSRKSLSKLLICILSAVTSYSRGGVKQMWILKNSIDRSLSSCISLKTIDFSTLYTAISHSKLKDILRELIQVCFIKKNGQRRYKYLVLGRDISYFVKKK